MSNSDGDHTKTTTTAKRKQVNISTFFNKKHIITYYNILLPKSVVDIKLDDINYIAEIVDKEYSYLHIEKQYFTSELELWIAKWTRVKNEGKYKIYYLFF